MADQNNDEQQLEDAHPVFSNSLLLHNIMEYLSITELKQARTTDLAFFESGTKQLRKRGKFCVNDNMEVSSFQAVSEWCRSEGLPAFSKLSLTRRYSDVELSNCTIAFGNAAPVQLVGENHMSFWNFIGPQVTTLTLRNVEIRGHSFQNAITWLIQQCPQLEKLKIESFLFMQDDQVPFFPGGFPQNNRPKLHWLYISDALGPLLEGRQTVLNIPTNDWLWFITQMTSLKVIISNGRGSLKFMRLLATRNDARQARVKNFTNISLFFLRNAVDNNNLIETRNHQTALKLVGYEHSFKMNLRISQILKTFCNQLSSLIISIPEPEEIPVNNNNITNGWVNILPNNFDFPQLRQLQMFATHTLAEEFHPKINFRMFFRLPQLESFVFKINSYRIVFPYRLIDSVASFFQTNQAPTVLPTFPSVLSFTFEALTDFTPDMISVLLRMFPNLTHFQCRLDEPQLDAILAMESLLQSVTLMPNSTVTSEYIDRFRAQNRLPLIHGEGN